MTTSPASASGWMTQRTEYVKRCLKWQEQSCRNESCTEKESPPINEEIQTVLIQIPLKCWRLKKALVVTPDEPCANIYRIGSENLQSKAHATTFFPKCETTALIKDRAIIKNHQLYALLENIQRDSGEKYKNGHTQRNDTRHSYQRCTNTLLSGRLILDEQHGWLAIYAYLRMDWHHPNDMGHIWPDIRDGNFDKNKSVNGARKKNDRLSRIAMEQGSK